MARQVPWRRTCPDVVCHRIEQANQARIYLLRETGPTGFLLKEDGNDKKFKVSLKTSWNLKLSMSSFHEITLWSLYYKSSIVKQLHACLPYIFVHRFFLESNILVLVVRSWKRENYVYISFGKLELFTKVYDCMAWKGKGKLHTNLNSDQKTSFETWSDYPVFTITFYNMKATPVSHQP